jgi:hypothetical protein
MGAGEHFFNDCIGTVDVSLCYFIILEMQFPV